MSSIQGLQQPSTASRCASFLWWTSSSPSFRNELESGFGSLSRILKPESPLSGSTLVVSTFGNSTVHCDWGSLRSCHTWVQYRFTLPVVHVIFAPSWSYILSASRPSLLLVLDNDGAVWRIMTLALR